MMIIPLEIFLPDENLSIMHIPFVLEKIPAGFHSPAESYVADYIDFNQYLISNPAVLLLLGMVAFPCSTQALIKMIC